MVHDLVLVVDLDQRCLSGSRSIWTKAGGSGSSGEANPHNFAKAKSSFDSPENSVSAVSRQPNQAKVEIEFCRLATTFSEVPQSNQYTLITKDVSTFDPQNSIKVKGFHYGSLASARYGDNERAGAYARQRALSRRSAT